MWNDGKALPASERISRTTDGRRRAIKLQNQKGPSAGLEIKLNRMNSPTFDGDIREYARFKSQYNKIVRPTISSNDDAIYVLKHECLKNEAEEHVRNVDDDLELEEIYRVYQNDRPPLCSKTLK